MRITPLDIRKHTFSRRLSGGYDRDEVDRFLRMVADDYEGQLREAEKLRTRVSELQARVESLSANEAVLQETLTTAQKLSEDLKRTAAKEAEVTISEAEIKAEKVLGAAHRRATRLADDIREMKALKARLATALRNTIETHLGLLEGLAADPPEDPEMDSKIGYMTRSRGDR